MNLPPSSWVTVQEDPRAILFRCCIGRCQFAAVTRLELHNHLLQHSSIDVKGGCRCPVSHCQMKFGGDIAFKNHLTIHSYEAYLQHRGMSVLLEVQRPQESVPRCCTTVARTGTTFVHDGDEISCLWSGCKQRSSSIEEHFIHVDLHINKLEFRGTGHWRCHWDECQSVHKTAGQLRRHLKTHTGERFCACPYCGVPFSNVTKFRDHLSRQQDELLDFQCIFCQKKFPSERLLHEHGRLHIPKFKCPVCQMPCQSRTALRLHVETHHRDEKRYKCKLCQQSFKTTSHLRAHFRSHGPKTKVECELCQKWFSANSSLKVHCQQFHQNVKRYKCHRCDDCFRISTKLTSHLVSVHGVSKSYGVRMKYRLCTDGYYRMWDISWNSENLPTASLDDVMADITRFQRAHSST